MSLNKTIRTVAFKNLNFNSVNVYEKSLYFKYEQEIAVFKQQSPITILRVPQRTFKRHFMTCFYILELIEINSLDFWAIRCNQWRPSLLVKVVAVTPIKTVKGIGEHFYGVEWYIIKSLKGIVVDEKLIKNNCFYSIHLRG